VVPFPIIGLINKPGFGAKAIGSLAFGFARVISARER
jgi:hypothetical protein